MRRARLPRATPRSHRSARWKIENENFNCLSRQGYYLNHYFEHGRDVLANLLAVLDLLTLAFRGVFDSLHGLWRKLHEPARHSARLL